MLSAKQLLKKNGENIFAWAEDRFINYLTNWEWIRISVDGQIRFEYATCGRGNFGIRKEKFADSKRLSGCVWMGPKTIAFLMFSCRNRRRFGSKTPCLVVEPGLYTLSMQVSVETSGFTARTRLLSVHEYRVTSKVLTVN